MTKRDVFAACMYALAANEFIKTTVSAIFHALGR
jgi:hypothetical protein